MRMGVKEIEISATNAENELGTCWNPRIITV